MVGMMRSRFDQAIGLDIRRNICLAVLVSVRGGAYQVIKCSSAAIVAGKKLPFREVLSGFPSHIPVIPVAPGVAQCTGPAERNSEAGNLLFQRIPGRESDFTRVRIRSGKTADGAGALYLRKSDVKQIVAEIGTTALPVPCIIPAPFALQTYCRENLAIPLKNTVIADVCGIHLRITAFSEGRLLIYRSLLSPGDLHAQEIRNTWDLLREQSLHQVSRAVFVCGADFSDETMIPMPTATGIPDNTFAAALGAATAYLSGNTAESLKYIPDHASRPVYLRSGTLGVLAGILAVLGSGILNIHLSNRRMDRALRAAQSSETQKIDEDRKALGKIIPFGRGIPDILAHLSRCVKESGVQIDAIRGAEDMMTLSGETRSFRSVSRFVEAVNSAMPDMTAESIGSDRDPVDQIVRFRIRLTKKRSAR